MHTFCSMPPSYYTIDPDLLPVLVKYQDTMFVPGKANDIYKNYEAADMDVCETYVTEISKGFHAFCASEKFDFTESRMKILRTLFRPGYSDEEVIMFTFETWLTYTSDHCKLCRQLFP